MKAVIANHLRAACCACCLLAPTILAQSSGQQVPGGLQSESGKFVLRQNVQEVLLYCTVLDSKGNLATDLDRSAFKVTENKVPAAIINFSHKDVPISMALVLDDSGSMKAKRPAVEEAARTLIKADTRDDEIELTNFADTAYLDQDFTNDPTKAELALQRSKTVSGGTSLFDTMIGAANHLAEAAQHSKQVIVVITDGRDNASAADLQAAIRRVQTVNGPVIYAIGLLYDVPGSDARRARHDLQALSDETGGIAFFPASGADVQKVAEEVARDIRNQYVIVYRPPASPGSEAYRTISAKASAKDKGKLTVRTRKGYLRASSATNVPQPDAKPANQ